MNKVIKRSIFICLLIGMLFITKPNTKASNQSSIEIIYDNESYLKNEEIQIDINLTNIYNLYEVDLKINIDEEYLTPKEELFTFKANSIYEEQALINDYVDNTLRLKLVKGKNINEGYTSNIKNNLTSIKLISNKKIALFKEYIKSNINIKLYDINGDLIDCEIDFNEKIKYQWNKVYELPVYSNSLNIIEDIKILNRKTSEYEISIEENINYLITGEYFIYVVLFDCLTNEIIKINKIVKILDLIKPTISSIKQEISLNDYEFKNVNLRNYFILKDNYDIDLELFIEYFNNENIELTKEEFYLYLESNLRGYITCYTVDKSNNVSDKLNMTLNIIDTVSPIVDIKDKLDINIDEIESFRISDYFTVFDKYDNNPLVIVNYFDENGYEIFNISEYLKTYSNFTVKIISIDESGNSSKEYLTNVYVIDNIAPSIQISHINLEDKVLSNLNYSEYIKISDNFDKNLEISFYIYNNEELIKIISSNHNEELKELLKNYLNLLFYVMVKDESGNITTTSKYKINILDTTPPTINYNKIDNILSISDLNISVEDNYSSNIDIKYYLNDEEITFNKLLSLSNGVYILKIVAIDSSMNRSEISHQFTISENIVEKDNDIQFKMENNLELIVIILLATVSFVILIIRLIRVKKYELIKNEV